MKTLLTALALTCSLTASTFAATEAKQQPDHPPVVATAKPGWGVLRIVGPRRGLELGERPARSVQRCRGVAKPGFGARRR